MPPTHLEGKIHRGHENVHRHHDRHHPGHRDHGRAKVGPRSAIDLSANNGSVDFAKVAPLDVMFKITEGATYRDPTATKERVREIRAAKIGRIAVYAFSRPDNNKPEAEVANVMRALEALDLEVASSADWYGDGPCTGVRVYNDFETPPFSEAWLHGWGAEFHRLAGHRADAYGYGESLNACQSALLEVYRHIDFAAYVDDWRRYCAPALQPRVAYWQDTSAWHHAGVIGAVDHDRYLLGGHHA